MAPFNTNGIRPLTDDEIARLEEALGQPIDRPYLVRWVLRAIHAFLVVMALPPLRERRDDLREMADRGRRWIDTVEQSSATPLLPLMLEVEQLATSVRSFCDAVESLAQQLDQSVGPGHPRTNIALNAFLDCLIGIAKRARVRPSTPSRALLGPTDSPPGPPFFAFVTEALDIAMEVIKSSPLPLDQIDAALAALKLTDRSLVKALERLRGRIGDYRDGTLGLVEWDVTENDEQTQSDAG